MRAWRHLALMVCLSIKWLTNQVAAESIICDDDREMCTTPEDFLTEMSIPDKRFLRFGRAKQPTVDDLLNRLMYMQSSDDFVYRKKRSAVSSVPDSSSERTLSHRSKRSVESNSRANDYVSASQERSGKNIAKRDTDELLQAKRFMRFGRSDGYDKDKRFIRFGRNDGYNKDKRFIRFGRNDGYNKDKRFIRFGKRFTSTQPGPAKRFMRFGRAHDGTVDDPEVGMDKRFMRFGRDPDKRFMRFGRDPEKRFIRFGRDPQKRFMRFGRGSTEPFAGTGKDDQEHEDLLDIIDQEFGKDFAQEPEKRFMRFGRTPEKRFMRFGRAYSGGKTESDSEVKDFQEGESGSLDNEFEKRFMRFGKRFMRFGKRDLDNGSSGDFDAISTDAQKDYASDTLLKRSVRSIDFDTVNTRSKSLRSLDKS